MCAPPLINPTNACSQNASAPSRPAFLTSPLAFLLWHLIRGYQLLIAPLLPPACRFYPSCSHYTQEALLKYGLCKGLSLALKRLARCHPWHPGGYDPVP